MGYKKKKKGCGKGTEKTISHKYFHRNEKSPIPWGWQWGKAGANQPPLALRPISVTKYALALCLIIKDKIHPNPMPH